MQDERIKDSQIQVKGGVWEATPSSTRLGSAVGWCIKNSHFDKSGTYMTVDLGKQYSVDAVRVKSVNIREADVVLRSKLTTKDEFTSYQENGVIKVRPKYGLITVRHDG